MTDLKKKKLEAINAYYRDKWSASEDELLCNIFDAGVKAERERVKELLNEFNPHAVKRVFPEDKTK